VKKRLGNFRLDVSFEASSGTLALLGASGCGKSVTLKCIAGIEKPDAGRIELNGRVLFDSALGVNLPPRARRVGYLFQQYSLFPNMTVAQNVLLGVRLEHRARRREIAAQMLAAMRLTGLENKRPAQLSGGQQQRTALARILVSEPELLLLDEPFSALDDYLKWQVELELSDTLKAFGGTSVFVSHSRDEVYRLCENVCVLTDGRSERADTVRGLFTSPGTLSACLISGCKNYTRARVLGAGRVEALDWGVTLRVPDAPPGTAYLGVRAHHVAPCAPSESGAENTVPCRVTRVVEDVFSTVVMLATPGGDTEFSRLRMELPKERWAALGAPETLTVQIRENDILPLKK
jgi:molybdate transport system ATP-binding protein